MFVLGVGAQKAGTSWLYGQLASQNNFRRLKRKELHFWDRRSQLHQPKDIRNFDISWWLTADSDDNSHRPDRIAEWWYFNRIRRALGNSGPSNMTADITPAYSGLTPSTFKQIRAGLEKYEIEYRIVLLLRDPIERILSAVGMNLDKINKSGQSSREEVYPYLSLSDTVKTYAKSWSCQFRTRYDLTLSNLEIAFPTDKIFVGFQEKIGSSNQLKDLENFLEVIPGSFSPHDRPNSGSRKIDADPIVRSEIAHLYRSTYRAMGNRFPTTQKLWGGFQYLA